MKNKKLNKKDQIIDLSKAVNGVFIRHEITQLPCVHIKDYVEQGNHLGLNLSLILRCKESQNEVVGHNLDKKISVYEFLPKNKDSEPLNLKALDTMAFANNLKHADLYVFLLYILNKVRDKKDFQRMFVATLGPSAILNDERKSYFFSYCVQEGIVEMINREEIIFPHGMSLLMCQV